VRASRGRGALRATPWPGVCQGGWADPRCGHQRAQGGRESADAGGWDCVKSGCIFPILSGERLIIRGEQKQSSERHGRDYYYAERSYGAFMRILPLPCEVDAEHAQARYKNGVLRVTLPKTAQAKSKRVKVQVRG
jgi:hypothetical protein